MVYVVSCENKHLYESELDQMFRSRHEVFVEDRGWNLKSFNRREIDEFDNDDSIYLLDSESGLVNSSVRLVSTEFPTIINEIFPELCTEGAPRNNQIWESSRGHIGRHCKDPMAWIRVMLAELEFSLLWGIEEVVFVIDTFLLPKWVAAGWNLQPLGPPTDIDDESYIACSIKISTAALRMMRDRYRITKPVMTYIADVPKVA